MQVIKELQPDQELIMRFLGVFGSGATSLGGNKYAKAGFFLLAHMFIHEYVEENFYKKENFLLKALEEEGFPNDDGPVGAMYAEQKKSSEAADMLLGAAKAWQAGDDEARVDVGWAASDYSSVLRKHMDRLKNLIFPLLDQNLTPEGENNIAEGFNSNGIEGDAQNGSKKYAELIGSMEEELRHWK